MKRNRRKRRRAQKRVNARERVKPVSVAATPKDTSNKQVVTRNPTREEPGGRLLSRSVRRFFATIAFLGTLAGLYQMRPILSASVSTTPNQNALFPFKLAFQNSGHIPVDHIASQFFIHKAVFSNDDTVIWTQNNDIRYEPVETLPSGDTATMLHGQGVRLFTRQSKVVAVIGDSDTRPARVVYFVHNHPGPMTQLFGEEGRRELAGMTEEVMDFADVRVRVQYSPWATTFQLV